MRFALKVLVIVLFAVVLLLPGVHGGFLLDDSINIVRNILLYINVLDVDRLIYAALSFHDGHGERALPMLSFALDYWRAGSMDASTFKATNIFIHAITIFVLALFLRRLLLLAKWTPQNAAWGALAVTLIWAIHPLQVSSVLYIVQRMQTMATLFIVLSLWSYLLMRQHQIAGGRGRVQGIFVIVFWLLALACKEDAILLPVFTLLLELTVLRFQAGQTVVVRGLKQCYTLIVVLGVLAFFLLFVPRYSCWSEVCGHRDFNSLERLLTQGRVLIMYLGQIILPLSDRMPFIYDTYPVSRSLWQPWTTLPAWIFVFVLIAWAWCWRHVRPLFAFGVLLFFVGHFVSSNVILLEMVFEHRNHLPLIGAVLALCDLILYVCQRLQLGYRIIASVFVVISLLLAASTLCQAYIWGDNVRLGQKMTKLVPTSTRAWAEYASFYSDNYYITRNSQDIIQAISITELGLKHIDSPRLIANVITYKSMLGELQEKDWQRFYQSLQGESSFQEKQASLTFLYNNFLKGYDIDQNKLIHSMEVFEKQGYVAGYLAMANAVYNSKQRDRAIIFFKKYVEKSPKNDPEVLKLLSALAIGGHTEWVEELNLVNKQKSEKNE